ncbi:ThuA domain-containing protein [Paraflavitalea sp. CAU 1676]|uniref:ThuA domain-containing protein n=1 Tax=Paraflavitalea sp. CAU 1676 TaxID=3032598 RepID=UPI0023D99FE3|nr:ThuA domain-containing protein [Paraflavitalea sp. CAU 1676]MDF2192104.1 ThuA domain-containing protein [Paraflavitalea sp. CAU 1676]
MKKTLRLLVFAVLLLQVFSCSKTRPGKARVLVFSKTTGYRHSSIPQGIAAIQKLGQEHGFEVDTTENADYFNEDSLGKYAAVVFLHTTADLLNHVQEADFERYIQSGGGYVGIHAASDAEYDWGWYGRLVGGYFESHPEQQVAKILVKDSTHLSTKHLPKVWERKDEWYNFKNLNPDVHVLLTIDEKSYQGGKNGDNHPMAWYHDYDGGRAFYTELGHTEESFVEDNYLKHLLGGLQYAIGKNYQLDYSKAKSLRTPDEDRFTKTVLAQGMFFEPTEMTILPNLDILVAQRRGELLLYKNGDSTGGIKQVGFLNVYHKTEAPNVNAEEGFMGLQADPNFKQNHYVYAFYSPKDTSVNRLSRFKFENDTLDMKSEHVILQFYSQRDICCHTGGSIAFGRDGNELFLSTGDNSTPFDEPNQKYVNHGFGPLDDRPGHMQYDARRSSSNTNDLRGKILRIKLKEDGTYEIPEGNLFPKGTANTRPEIYVMGNRNPYRISVDKKNNFLYWGEVGPDASNDSLATRGPRGYDEVNQARQAGYFGWPLFVGNNYAYQAYDYNTGATAGAFDAAKPVNSSRNNTGLQALPPAQPAFIWYPYGNSKDFPQVGAGGRNAMAGPVYYTEMFPSDTRLPDYYNDKLFIYDWIRGWIKAVTMKPNGDFDKMEPFMEHTKLNSMIDFEVGPDGKLYMLEYGTGWFSKNADAAISRVDYNGGNRAPKVDSLQVTKTAGALPFTVKATVKAKDPEKDKLTYTWHIGDATKVTNEPALEYEISKAGDYAISVEVSDDKNAKTKSSVIDVYAGNEAPVVSIALQGNQSFYFPGKPVLYSVKVDDKDDTATAKDLSSLIVSADYVEGSDKAGASQGHQVLTEAMMGKNLMLSLDCKTCHKVDEKSIGPSFVDVAKKYEKDPQAVSYLVNKIIKGGGGVWGEVAMAAHPNLKDADAKQILTWIQSLTAAQEAKKSLPATGSLQPTLGKPAKDNGVLYISASYTDKGGNNIKPLTANEVVTLRSSKVPFRRVKKMEKYTSTNVNGSTVLVTPKAEGWFAIDNIDLTSVSGATLNVGYQQPAKFGYTFEVRLDAPDGKKLGTFTLPGSGEVAAKPDAPYSFKDLSTVLEAVTDGKKHSLYIVSKPTDVAEPNQVGLLFIQFK